MPLRLPILLAAVTFWGVVGSLAATAQELRGKLFLLGQVREGDQTRETEAPNEFYGDLQLVRLPHGTRLDGYFRLERDFGIDDGASDFYAGSMRVPAGLPGVDVSIGRQFLSEGPGGAFVADAGRVRIDRGWPVSLTLFGGAPRYFEPTYGPSVLSRDETLWGGSIRSRRWNGGQLTAGYFGLDRDDHVLRQLLTGTASQSLASLLPAAPYLYGSIAYDPDHQNLDLASAGVNLLPVSRVQLNFESSYYKPQDHEHRIPLADPDRREDAIFELFAASALWQWRTGASCAITPAVTAALDYSFQNYEHVEDGQIENSHLASLGLLWLPGGDGLEVVRLDYFVIDSDTGRVNGGKAYYENRVYERLVFRARFDVAGYEKENNQSDVAVSGLAGMGFVILPGLVWELTFEGNHNDRFDEDLRIGFQIDYNFRHTFRPSTRAKGKES